MPIRLTCGQCGRTLSVPDAAAGKRARCPICDNIVPIPAADVRDAEEIGAEEIAAEASHGDTYGLASDNEPQPPRPSADEPPRRPCPICGEMIVVGAAKCRFCNAIFDLALQRQEAAGKVKPEDTDLSVGDWIFCILCSGIACIFGIVYAIQGKPKGGKMIGIAIVASICWTVLRLIIEASTHQPGYRY